MIFNLNAGNIVAKLRVKFPAGSVVTVTSGAVTLTAQNASADTQYTFMIPFPGDWTITIVVGGVTTTQTVTIAAGVDQNIAPAVKQHIFDKGHTCNDITGGWERWCGWQDHYTINTSYPDGYLQYGNAGDNDGGVGTVNNFVVPTWAKWFKGTGTNTGTASGGTIQLLSGKDGWGSTAQLFATLSLSGSTDITSVQGKSVKCGKFLGAAHHNDDDSLKPYLNITWTELWFESDTTI